MRKVRNAVKRLIPSLVRRQLEREYFKETHINRALGKVARDTTYVEIGVRDGECIAQIRAATRIAIDPAPVGIENSAWEGVVLHKQTSDDYFRTTAPVELRNRPVDVALVDGLHEFRQALRDVLNLEQYMSPNGVIFIHDCNPPTRENAENENGPWNGDVWKVALYLRRFRSDLKFLTLNCDWGLGVVSGFSTAAIPPETRNIEQIAALDYDHLARDRKRILNLQFPLKPRF
jgi:hypothetical protein